MNEIRNKVIELISHLECEKLIPANTVLIEKNLVNTIKSLKEVLVKKYPKTKLREPIKALHYANKFDNGGLKNIAFLLEEISQLLFFNNHLDEKEVTSYFNTKMMDKTFDFTPINLVSTTIEGLCLSKK